MAIITVTYGKIINQYNDPNAIYSAVKHSYYDVKPLQYNIQSYRDGKLNEYHLFTSAVWLDQATLNEYIESSSHKTLKNTLTANIFVDRKVKKIENVKIESNEVKNLQDTMFECFKDQAIEYTDIYKSNNSIRLNHEDSKDFTILEVAGSTVPDNVAYY